MPATAPSEVELGHALPARAGGGTGGPLDPPARLATSRTSGDPLVAGAGGDPEEPSTATAPAAGLDYADYLAARAANAPGARLAAWCATRPHALCNVPALAAWALAAVLVVVLAGRSGGRPAPGGLASTGGDAGLSPEGRLAATAGVGADYRGRPRSLLAAGGAVASDHGRCSDAGAAILRAGGNAADAAVTTALCLGVHNPMASGIGGGALILVRGAKGAVTAIDAREAAPAGAAADMYGSSDTASLEGGLAVGVPMELWGLHTLHADHGSGRVAWADLVRPAADAARAGFEAHPYLVAAVSAPRALARLKASPALAAAFLVKDAAAPGGYRPPRVNETCCARPALAATLDAVGRDGPAALYSGARAAALAADVRAAGGILTEADLAAAAARSAPPLTTRAWGMDFYVPPPPSSGAALLAALAIAAGWEAPLPFERGLGAHRLVEAMKHGMALRVGMGDVGACGAGAGGGEEDGSSGATAPSPSPAVSPPRRHFHLLAAADAADPACFPGTSHVPALIADALTPAFAAHLRASIADNATAPPASYGGRWGMGAAGAGLPPEDHGTSHLSVVDADRQAVSLTTTGELFYGRMGGGKEEGRSFYLFSTCLSPIPSFFFFPRSLFTVNTGFGSGVLSPSTGILLNNQMDDFSRPGRPNGYGLPPGPANFIAPGKRPLSSMVPLIAADPAGSGGGLRLVMGGSGGPRIITAVLTTAARLVAFGEGPLQAVAAPRLHHQLLPDSVFAEDWAAPGDGGLVEKVAPGVLASLKARGHAVKPAEWGGVVQAIVVPPAGEPGDGTSSNVWGVGDGHGGRQAGAPLEAASDPRKDGAPAGVDL